MKLQSETDRLSYARSIAILWTVQQSMYMCETDTVQYLPEILHRAQILY